jgi:hypothetical protein
MHLGEVLKRAFTREKLFSTDRTFFDIATRHMELTFQDPTVVAWYFGIPTALLFTVTNPRNVSALESNGRDFLGSNDFLRPTFNHRHAPVQNSLWLSHDGRLPRNCRQSGSPRQLLISRVTGEVFFDASSDGRLARLSGLRKPPSPVR